MARYVTLIRFTDQGARGIRNSPARALAFNKTAEKTGISVEVQLWTVGACDGKQDFALAAVANRAK